MTMHLELRLDPDGTAQVTVDSEDWHPDAAVEPWLNAWRHAGREVLGRGIAVPTTADLDVTD